MKTEEGLLGQASLWPGLGHCVGWDQKREEEAGQARPVWMTLLRRLAGKGGRNGAVAGGTSGSELGVLELAQMR